MSKGKTDIGNFSKHVFIYLGCNFHTLKTAVDICRRWHDLSDSVNFQNEDRSPSDENQQATDSESQVGKGGIEWWK